MSMLQVEVEIGAIAKEKKRRRKKKKENGIYFTPKMFYFRLSRGGMVVQWKHFTLRVLFIIILSFTECLW